ncbi:MAG: outer membrane beta-barrel protein [Hyphomicrobiaceae bacterium]
MWRSDTRTSWLLLWLSIVSTGLSAPVGAQPVDFTQQSFSTTLAQIEKADGWYDEVNYGAASAGLRGKKYYLPDGINAGSYRIYMTLGAGTTYDDNIYRSAKERVADFETTGLASVDFISRFPRHLFDVHLAGKYVSYADQEDFNTLDGSALAEWRLDIDHGHALGGRVSSSYDHETRVSPEAPLLAREAVPVFKNAAEIAFTRDQGRLGASAGLDFADLDYSDVEAFDGTRIDQDFRDKTSYGAYLRLNYRFSPGYKLLSSLRAGREIYHTPSAQLGNATVYEGKLGLAFELSPLWQANLSAGYGLADYDAIGERRFGAFVYDAQLQWLASPILTMTLTAGQSIAETRFGSSGAILESRAELLVEYEAMRNLMLRASAGYERAEIGWDDRIDDTVIGKIGAEYTINKNLLFTMGYERQERYSSDPDYDMQDNRYMVGLKYRF